MGWSICAKRDALNCVPFPKDLVHLLHLDCVCKKCWISIQKSVFFLFLFLVFKYCSREGRLSAANGQSKLWRLNIHIILLSSALNKISTQCCYKIGIIREFLAIWVFYLAVAKFYLELAESRQNLWLSEWELSLSQKKKCLTQWHSQKDTPLLQVKKVKWCTYHFYRVDFLTPAHPTPSLWIRKCTAGPLHDKRSK